MNTANPEHAARGNSQAGFIPNAEHAAIRNSLLVQRRNTLVNACAGSGKTSTTIWLVQDVPWNESLLILSFGKDIIATMKDRLPVLRKDCAVTYNALGHRAAAAHKGRKLQLEADKLFSLQKDWRYETREVYGAFTRRLVGLARNAGIGTLQENVPSAWFELASHHQLSLDSENADLDEAVRIAQQLLESSNRAADDGLFDFDDQLYQPIRWKLKFLQYQWLFVDEAQDTNAIQVEIVSRSLLPNGVLGVFGEVSQAIYGFRGADAESMQKFKIRFNMNVLPLSTCYRCSQAVVREAQKYVTTI